MAFVCARFSFCVGVDKRKTSSTQLVTLETSSWVGGLLESV